MKKRMIIIPESEEEEKEILEKLGTEKDSVFKLIAEIIGKYCTIENIEKCKEYAYKILTEPQMSVVDFLTEVGVSEDEINNIKAEAEEKGIDITKPIKELIGG